MNGLSEHRQHYLSYEMNFIAIKSKLTAMIVAASAFASRIRLHSPSFAATSDQSEAPVRLR